MNLTLSLPPEIAEKAKTLAARQGQSLSAWFRERVDKESDSQRLREIHLLDPQTAEMVGAALPLQTHWEDPRWRAMAEKHLQ